MKIIPRRFRFIQDGKNRKSSKIDTESPPKEVTVDRDLNGTECWRIRTHDYDTKTNSYYQIAFSLDSSDPYKDDELEISLTDSSRADGKVIWDKLSSEEALDQNGEVKTWWYQNTSYDKNGRPKSGVDCITAAGVFRVFVKVKNTDKIVYTSPWIYVLPFGVKVKEYLDMLNDLIALHDAFVTRSNSAVGIGEAVDDLEEWVTRMKHVLGRIERNPAVNLEKCYTKTPVHKLHKFDSRVFRDYMRSGGAGKTASIDYNESLDVYENRVIKTFLERIPKLLEQLERSKSGDLEVKLNNFSKCAKDFFENELKVNESREKSTSVGFVNQELKLLYSNRSATNTNVAKIFIKHNDKGFYVATNWEEEKNANFSHYPFEHNTCKYVGINYTTSSPANALEFLKCLCKFYDNIANNGEAKGCFTIHGCINTNAESRSGTHIRKVYYIKDCSCVSVEINGAKLKADLNRNDILTEQDYYSNLTELMTEHSKIFAEKHCSFVIEDKGYDEYLLDQSSKARSKYLEEISKKRWHSQYHRNFIEEVIKIYTDNKWLSEVALQPDIYFPLKVITPKFARDPNYREIYSLMDKMASTHYILSGHLDVNAFGVRDTQEVYEYWVFYKILSRLLELGFEPDKPASSETLDAETNLKNIFDQFVQEGGISRKNFQIYLCKNIINDKCLRIVFYYNYEFKNMNNEKKRTPDYALFFPDNGHWYFFDAKYKKFNKAEQKQKAEVRDVAAHKYIHDMSQILKNTDSKIMGSYLIVAEPAIHTTTDGLQMFSQLLDIEYLTNDKNTLYSEELYSEELKSAVYKCGPHPIGMVQLTPDNETAFNALFKLIFEYKEGCGNGNQKFNVERDVCWECGSTKINRQLRSTSSGYEKYYVTCETCGEFRVETHCQKGNHTLIKHAIDSYHMPYEITQGLTNWYVKCPFGCKNEQSSPNPIDYHNIEESDELPF